MNEVGNPKPEYAHLQRKNFTQFVHFLTFDEDKWVRYILSHVHDEFIWLDRPYKITKKAIHAVTCLNQINDKPNLRKVTNPTITKLTSAQFDNRSMTIDDIREHDIRFALMIIGYKVYQSSKLNSISDTTFYVVYQIMKEDIQYDLCTILLNELLSNLKKIKTDKKNIFKFGSLIVCLALYFMNEIHNTRRVQWAYDLLVTSQIRKGLQRLGNR